MCILRHKDELLLLKRLREPNKDMYTPVGGKLDPFEGPYEAALRETLEETGVKLSYMRFCGTLIETSPASYNWCSFVYVADIDRIPPPLCTEGSLEWIPLSNVLKVPAPKTDWHIYKYVMEGKPFAFRATFDEKLILTSMTEDIEEKTMEVE